MTATEELRALLDERGVEWWEDAFDCKHRTIFDGENNVRYCVHQLGFSLFISTVLPLTPEQAVEATLGRGTCKWEPADFITEGEWWNTSCGESFTWEPDGTPRYCPNCGRKVVS